MSRARSIFRNILRIVIRLVVFFTTPIFYLLFGKHKQTLLDPDNHLLLMSATELSRLIRSKAVSSEEVLKAYINQINLVNPKLNAMVYERFDEALEDAKKIDLMIHSGKIPNMCSPRAAPFLGVPISIKESFAVSGMPQSSGMLTRENYISEEDSALVTNLRQHGCIPICVTNTSELCMWYESSNLVYGRTVNAYHHGRTAGGSSGGEACLISAACSLIGIGSDVGGSIRIPANFNGIFSHKPTAGIVSTKGHFPSATNKAETFLCAGPLCRYASDLSTMLKMMTQSNAEQINLDSEVDIAMLKYYYMVDDGGSYWTSPVDPQIKDKVKKAAQHFRSFDAEVTQTTIEDLNLSFEIWAACMRQSGTESFCSLMGNSIKPASPLAELIRWLFCKPRHTLPAIGLGLAERLSFFNHMDDELIEKCENLKSTFNTLLKDDGVFIYPSHPVPAPYHNQSLLMPFNFAYTAIFNVLGFPVTQVPMGISKEGVPIGIQIVANKYKDRLCLAVARELETAFGGWVPPF